MKKTILVTAIILSSFSFNLVQGETKYNTTPTITTPEVAKKPEIPAPTIQGTEKLEIPSIPTPPNNTTPETPKVPTIELPQLTPNTTEATTSDKNKPATEKDTAPATNGTEFKIYDPNKQFKQPAPATTPPPAPAVEEKKPEPKVEPPKVEEDELKKAEEERKKKEAEKLERNKKIKEARKKKIEQILSLNYHFQVLSKKIYKNDYNKDNMHLPSPLPEDYYHLAAFALIKEPDEDLSSLRSIIEELGNVNAIIDDYGNNLLHHAVVFNRLDIARMLIGMGINPAIPNKYDVTPLALAKKIGNVTLYNALLSRVPPASVARTSDQYMFTY
jgi:hypothetical protein